MRRGADFFRRTTLLAGLGAVLCASPLGALAQTHPDKPVRLVVGYAPGTAPDVLARLVAGKLGEVLKQQVIVDNKAGAGGQIAAANVAKSPADGYSLLLGEVGSIAIAPTAFSKLPYDPAKELIGIAEVGKVDFLLAVPVKTPQQTVAEFIKAHKGQAERVNFGTFGAGTSGHFGAELFGEAAGFKVEPIHYRATGDAVTAIVNGDVAGAFVSTALGAAQVKGGKMKALATTAPQRSPLLPDVPTFAEVGMPKMDFSAWFAMMAPAGTPTTILDQINKATLSALENAELRQKIVDAGFSVSGLSRADTERMLRNEAQRWAGIVKASGFKGD